MLILRLPCRNLGVLRAMSKNWLPLLLNAFVSATPATRGPLGRAISAYAANPRHASRAEGRWGQGL